MPDSTLNTLLVIITAATVAPLIADLLARWLPIPTVLLELLAGIIVGPAVLGWAHDGEIVSALAEFGLVFLMLLAGYEINFQAVRGAPMRRAVHGWLLGLPIAAIAGWVIGGPQFTAVYVALALTTTALGTILPIVRDAGWLGGGFGARVLATGAIGEFGPIVAIALLLTSQKPLRTALLLAVFGVIIVLTVVLATRPRHPRLARVITATLGSSGQLAIRLVVFVAAVMVWIAAEFGLDILLGAFAAGMVLRLFIESGDHAEAVAVESKMDAIGFGLFIPLFFVVSGIRFDLRTLLDRPLLFVLLLAVLLLFLLVRAVPTYLIHRGDLDAPGDRRALAVLAGSALPLVVVITGLGTDAGDLDRGIAAAMVGAGMLSVLVFPLSAMRLRRAAVSQPTVGAG